MNSEGNETTDIKITTKSDNYSQFEDSKELSQDIYESFSIIDEEHKKGQTGSVFPDSLFQPYEVQLQKSQRQDKTIQNKQKR